MKEPSACEAYSHWPMLDVTLWRRASVFDEDVRGGGKVTAFDCTQPGRSAVWVFGRSFRASPTLLGTRLLLSMPPWFAIAGSLIPLQYFVRKFWLRCSSICMPSARLCRNPQVTWCGLCPQTYSGPPNPYSRWQLLGLRWLSPTRWQRLPCTLQ